MNEPADNSEDKDKPSEGNTPKEELSPSSQHKGPHSDIGSATPTERAIGSIAAIWALQLVVLIMLPSLLCAMQDQMDCRDCYDCIEWQDFRLLCGPILLVHLVLERFLDSSGIVRLQINFFIILYGTSFAQCIIWALLTGQTPFKSNSI